ncbi:hypothetical protein [Chryseolinea soli]|uniref:Uncharacterized protein n=1 Tax=Chryseolinea soli TaxID=2321403 RepID=A0A385SPW1_9BACT|nr:hypothetical protein [Chryseolinea soli]AYB31540.1 hypothetical protein D4L85_13585 [Chryseolinea soli]
MKPLRRRILALCVVVTSIIAFWLKPGINAAQDTTYARRYEDTDRKAGGDSLAINTHRRKYQKPETSKALQEKKVYKTQRISSKDKLSKLEPEMFSRAIQFEDSLVVKKELEDVAFAEKDTLIINP